MMPLLGEDSLYWAFKLLTCWCPYLSLFPLLFSTAKAQCSTVRRRLRPSINTAARQNLPAIL